MRVVDVSVLKAPMTMVTGEIVAPGGVNGSGSVFAIANNGDNQLATLRYKFRDADFKVAEDTFSGAGRSFARGSYVVRGISRDDLDKAAKALGISVYALSAEPNVKTHALRAPRVAILHAWHGTQTEGWWRLAFDKQQVPYDYISTQDVAKIADLNAKYDVIVFPPARASAQQIVDGMPMWRNPMPWKKSAETPNIGAWAQTDDIRPGLGYDGLRHLKEFVTKGGLLITSANT